MNTPDTEWEIVQNGIIKNAILRDKVEKVIKRNCTSWSKNLQNEMSHLFYQTLEKTISSRDTYWKERVQETKRKLELEYIEGECVECAGTGEGADNPNSDSGETYPCHLCKGRGRFSGYTKKTVDTLLDNLK